MKHKIKRLLSLLLSLMMLLSLLPTAVLADESATKTYTKVTSADELVTGEYVMVANNGYAPGVRAGRARLEGEESIHCLRCAPQALTFCYHNSTL